MYLYPMGDESNEINPNSLSQGGSRRLDYKSAEVIDVESEDLEDEEVLSENNLYKRITKQWLIAQEIARFTLFTSCTSFLFLVFRSLNWFPLVVSLFALELLGVGLTFSLAWSRLSNINRVRLFSAGILTGFSAAISSSDIIYLTYMTNQVLVLSVISIGLVVLTLIGILFGVLSYKRKVLRY